jgi:hypothetical protein
VAALATFVLRDSDARKVMIVSIGALVGGVALTLVAISADSTLLFFLGTGIAGVGFGGGFQGGIRTVVPLAEAHDRAGVLSLLFVVSYLGLGGPAVAAGFLVVDGGGLPTTAREYGIFVMVLAVVALGGLVRSPAGARGARPVGEELS